MPIFRKVTCRPFLIGLNWLYSSSGVKCFYDNPPFIIANRINDVYNKQEIIKNILNEIKVPRTTTSANASLKDHSIWNDF